ncbi:ASCH/PUA domain-containing protein [Rummeliibacillus stabekisii]|uniref:RNA-binding protein n=1 Tax=Rummeliibacillus stabekisii TaxID=241244 RepID=A0A143HFD3_9BACL|nr:ASCH/PUA domain-containing protein [Rummeliibacillus stabekisii]AMX00434.1 RNA-binding protein [Rummeliibacillus stabekisii]
MTITHSLKILPQYFAAVTEGRKTFEIRKNDRGFHEGDFIVLREWNGQEFTGGEIAKRITYITDFEQQPGFVVMGFQ